MQGVEYFGQLLNAKAAQPTQRLALLGASGSIGATTLACLRRLPSIRLEAVSVHRSLDQLRTLLLEFSPRYAAITDSATAAGIDELRNHFPDTEFYAGEAGALQMLRDAATTGLDTVLTAVVGAAGIRATVLAIELGLKVALANKETLVTAGPIIHSLLSAKDKQSSRACIIPVDSEHNSAFQLLEALPAARMKRLILTGSGGPFRDLSPAEIREVTREQALQHPTWSMGPKITVDSAGMINKGLELIEAHYLFSIPYERLDAVIHRKSIVHALVELSDGSYTMAASQPEMGFPIQHALCYPAPPPLHPVSRPPTQWGELRFESVDLDRYPGFALCLQAGRAGGGAPAVLNAANESAVQLLLEDRIRFAQIPEMIESALAALGQERAPDLETLLELDRRTRERVFSRALPV